MYPSAPSAVGPAVLVPDDGSYKIPLTCIVGGRYQILHNFTWSQSKKFVWVKIAANGLSCTDHHKIFFDIMTNSLQLTVEHFSNSKWSFMLNSLAHSIVPDKCIIDARKDEVLLLLAKKKTQQWLTLDGAVKKQPQERTEHLNKNVPQKSKNNPCGDSKRKPDKEPESHSHPVNGEGGCWTVTDPATAREVLGPICAGQVAMVRVAVTDKYTDTSEFAGLTVCLGRARCGVMFRFLDTFWPTMSAEKSYRKDAARIKVLTQGRCSLMEFWGHLRPADLKLLPPSVMVLGFAVHNQQDYSALLSLRHLHSLMSFNLLISRHVKAKALSPLPERFTGVSLHFYGMEDQDGEWMMLVINKLMSIRRPWLLRLPSCRMTPVGARILGRRLKGSNLRGMAQDSPNVPSSARAQLDMLYAKSGFQSSWTMDSVYDDSEEECSCGRLGVKV